MTALAHPGPKTSGQHAHDGARKPLRAWWPILLIIGIVLACAAGVGVTASLTDPVAPARVLYREPDPKVGVPAGQAPNANTREGRVSTTATDLPNANMREGRVPAVAPGLPNANTREGRVSTELPNANSREDRSPGNG
jgi:hypothetical protein